MKKQILFTFTILVLAVCLIGAVSAEAADENDSSISENTINDTTTTIVETEKSTPDVTITGEVQKCSDGNPFPGVKVTVTSSEETISTTTNADGTYSLNFKSDSTNFKVTASAPGHQTSAQEVHVLPGEDNVYQGTANFKLGMDTVYVATTGNDTTGDGTQANPYQTIAKGITEVNPDGTVNVADGTYYEHLVIDKNLNLVGQSQENTILDGSNTGRPLTINTGATVNISLFTIQNGVSSFSGGAIDNYGTVTVNSNTFINNSAQYGGAIFNAYGSTLNVIESTFIDNRGFFGGGGIYDAEGTSTVTDSTFTNNLADYGGAIYTYGTVTVSDSTFTGNNATNYGGAIYNFYGYDYDATLNVTESTFNGNTAPFGGAIYNYATLSVSDSSFTGNTATYGGGISNYGTLDVAGSTINGNTAYYGGGGIYNTDTVTVSGSTISGNTATSYGGGIWNNANVTVSGSTISGNTANVDGGGIASGYGTVTVSGSTISGNTAQSGGGIWNYGGTLTVSGSTISGNTAQNSYGGGIYNYGGTVNVNFNRIVNNSLTAMHSDGGSADARYNWWGSNNPNFATLISGAADYSLWLYMTFQADPTTIQQGETSTLTANFNNAYDGVNPVTPFDPVIGHLPDGILVTFTTDLGQVGSQTVDKPTVNGVATATLTGTESGLANLSATLDDETLTFNVEVTTDPCANVTITKTGNGPLNVGDTGTFTITLHNNGPDGAHNVAVTDVNVPLGWTVTPSVGSWDPTTSTWNVGTLNNGADVTLTISGLITTAMAGTSITNTVTETQDEQNQESQTATASITINPMANVTITKTGNGPLNVGDTGIFTITLHNNGSDAAHNVAVTDVNVPLGWTVTPSVGSWDPTTSTWNVGTLNNGADATLTISGLVTTAMAGTTLTNTVTETQDEQNQESQTATASITVNSLAPMADLYINSWSSKNNPNVGEIFTIIFKLGNNGPDTAENVVFTLPLPDGVEFVDVDVDQGTTSYDPATRTITWTLGDVVVGDPYAWVRVRALNVGSFIFPPTLTTDTDDPNLESNIQRLTVNVLAASGSTETVHAQTVGMQETGTPALPLALVILSLLGGLMASRKKQ